MLISLYPNTPAIEGGKVDLPAAITRAASKQTYYTIRFLMDRDRVDDAFRAYAYFRWIDDLLDAVTGTQQDKKEFMHRQRELLDKLYQGIPSGDLSPEEQMLSEMVRNDHEKESGLQLYLRNMMAVMSFDVERRGQAISQAELSQYSFLLAKAVTEYMFYFIGHDDPPPESENRYQAVSGAHVVHMLRDMVDDIAIGYFNIPAELLAAEHISLDNLQDRPFRKWVYERAELAHRSIESGRKYISQVKSFRCRLAGFAYLARFEWMLQAIEHDQYCLRSKYNERKNIKAGLWIIWRAFTSTLNLTWAKYKPAEPVVFLDQCEEE